MMLPLLDWFFSSTTLLVLGALFAFVNPLDKYAGLVNNLPFAQTIDLQTLEFEILVLAFVLIYALFRFLWSIRQFNLLTIMLGAFPAATLPSPKSRSAPLHIVGQTTRSRHRSKCERRGDDAMSSRPARSPLARLRPTSHSTRSTSTPDHAL